MVLWCVYGLRQVDGNYFWTPSWPSKSIDLYLNHLFFAFHSTDCRISWCRISIFFDWNWNLFIWIINKVYFFIFFIILTGNRHFIIAWKCPRSIIRTKQANDWSSSRTLPWTLEGESFIIVIHILTQINQIKSFIIFNSFSVFFFGFPI